MEQTKLRLRLKPTVLTSWNADRRLEVPGLPAHALATQEKDSPDYVDERALRKLAHQVLGARVLFWEDMRTAERMAQQEYFYTAMNLEWRGRVYSVPSFNFQREDRVRALFLFARGEPIGEEGVYWLKVHVANCGDFNGIKKRPFGERVKWVDDNLELIRSMAEIPVSMFKRWVEQTAKHPEHKWQGPDKPFLFLSACLELSAALRAGPSYVSHLPVSFDGSCSGLQHLCAMTRAPEGSSVNLTPQEVPADIYQTVADRVKQRIEGDLKSQDKQRRELAQMCLKYGITRKIVKRNVMTYSYGSNAYGMTEQLREDLMQPLSKEVALGKREEHPFGSGLWASDYLARQTYAAIEEVIHGPAQAKTFLQKLARSLSHEGKPLRWKTPVGLPLVNRYQKVDTKQGKLWLHDRGVRVRYTVKLAIGDQAEIDKTRAANGIAPNFVHALDAAHLLRTVNAAVKEGITSLATVHDSFGCPPSRAARFRRLIREEFVRMYNEHDVLAEVYEQARADLSDVDAKRMPSGPPQKGSLQIEQLLDAEFAFA
jgi:DNA-directed RNA polymerase, mitochondrial